MKWPAVLILVGAFLVLLFVSSQRPDSPDDTATDAAAAPASATPPSPAPVPRPVSANTPPRPAPAAPQTVTGMAVAGNGDGVPGLDVQLLDTGDAIVARTRSDGTGRFQLRAPRPGDYHVRARDPNFLYTVSSRVPVTVSGDSPAEARVVVERGSTAIEGQVMNGAGKPLTDEEIVARSGESERSVWTDARGRFRLGGLPQGEWRVFPQRFPASTQTVMLRPGEEQAIEFLVKLPASMQLHLSDSHLAPYLFTGSERVLIKDADGKTVASATPDADGEVSFEGLPAGRYEVTAVDGAGNSLLRQPVVVDLMEGSQHHWALSIQDALRGSGVHVPGTVKLLIILFFALMVVLPPLVFPAPMAPSRPPQAPATVES